jgi:hypothetical protein
VFTRFVTEAGYDYFYVRNGSDANGTSVATLTGNLSGSVAAGSLAVTVASPSGGCVSLQFTSDLSIVASGVALYWTANANNGSTPAEPKGAWCAARGCRAR